jgi:hypothetical protein
MWFFLAMLIGAFLIDPNARSVADTFFARAENLVDTQFPVFFAAVALTLLASAFSWFMTSWPRRHARQQFRVVKRYWVQQ